MDFGQVFTRLGEILQVLLISCNPIFLNGSVQAFTEDEIRALVPEFVLEVTMLERFDFSRYFESDHMVAADVEVPEWKEPERSTRIWNVYHYVNAVTKAAVTLYTSGNTFPRIAVKPCEGKRCH